MSFLDRLTLYFLVGVVVLQAWHQWLTDKRLNELEGVIRAQTNVMLEYYQVHEVVKRIVAYGSNH